MNLKKGMTEDEILGELNGRVHGETSQEFANFVNKKFNHIDHEYQFHEVVLANNEYALLVKWNHSRGLSGKLEFQPEYFLAGISDEGYYFVKEIPNFLYLFETFPPSLEEILDKINKKEDSYQRIQGDVLFRFANFSDFRFESEDFFITQEE